MLHTEPSFSVYADGEGLIDVGKRDTKGSGEFSFGEIMGFENLGIVEKEDVKENYMKLVDEDPSNPLFLKNYAHILKSNGDLNGAEEYYFRATQADPKDGEILMQYAKLIWELHHDQDRASGYFEAAVLAAPQDCDVLAAYARFLWEIDDDTENNEAATPTKESLAVDENCREPLLLRNHAQFLQETKGDFKGAEEYYSRAVQADPGDGQLVSQYAQLVWELYHDQHKASGYFEQAVEAAPTNSDVLAAYAKFLWEADEEASDKQAEKL
uniref:uncharacterized protein LOC122581312 n=1 Tax=Erigeron canadensis TaxID=72917 RepID=UPI001CB9B539|nr:uncharacterized protein LOC122581312 [Erigeron canadensis]